MTPRPGRTFMCAASLLGLMAGSARAQSPGQLNVCHAGSLTAAFTQVEKEFKAHHAGVAITDTAGGSIDLIRQLAAGARACDVYASADALNIDLVLKPAGLADYTIVLANGRMVLAYLATDPRANDLPISGEFKPPSAVPAVAADWYRTLFAPGVRVGVAHPFLDPGGYRSHLIFDLAQIHYNVPGFYNEALQHFAIIPADPADQARSAVLGREINFQITYEHNAAATAKGNPDYRYARLPDDIDLSNPLKEKAYARASVTMPGLGVAGAAPTVTIPASRATWGLTILTNSANRENAIAFVNMLLGPVGTRALIANGPTPITPAIVSAGDYARLPESMRMWVEKGRLAP